MPVIKIGGYAGTTYRARWRDGILPCHRLGGGYEPGPLPVFPGPQPTDKRWRAFWKSLADVGNWTSRRDLERR